MSREDRFMRPKGRWGSLDQSTRNFAVLIVCAAILLVAVGLGLYLTKQP